ncbi:MAG: diguanylate cyclase, partial [Gammaproteobacteria bacterium]|nr:diguanylate cyclase [Gammaproteobacteria bacterium]
MVVFTEQIATIQQNTADFNTFIQILDDSWPDLELLGNLTSIQIYSSEQPNKPDTFGFDAQNHVSRLALKTLENMTLEQDIFCISECFLATSVPMFRKDGFSAVVLVKPFTELIVAMARLNEVEIILIPIQANTSIINSQSGNSSNSDWVNNVSTLTNAEKFRPVLNAIAQRVDLSVILNSNVTLNLFEAHYQLWNLTSDTWSIPNYRLLIVDDVTNSVANANRHKVDMIVVVLIGILVFAIVVVLLTISPIKSVQHLIGQYPLIAMHQFDEVRKEITRPNVHYVDEVDILYDETNELVDRLQRLNEDLYNKSKELEHKAMHDELTQLGNRNTLTLELNKIIKTTERNPRMWGLVYLDLDNFKQINDNLGHDAGDQLLKVAANRLSDSLRLTDVVCRLGGDEFTVILNELSNRDDIELVMNKIFHLLKQPVMVNGHELSVQVSAGVYISHGPVEIEKIMRCADIALYAAKDAGRNCYQLFDEKMSHLAERKFLIEKEFETSLENDEFKLALQPQTDCATGELVGFEALIRWHYHHKDWIFPDDFIPVLEESDRIVKLGQWVAKNAVLELVQLSKFKSDLKMAINLSARQLFDDDLLPMLNDVCEEYDIAKERIELELTETVLIDDIKHAQIWMESAQKQGYRVAIDDFGTGYSSLSYISSLP